MTDTSQAREDYRSVPAGWRRGERVTIESAGRWLLVSRAWGPRSLTSVDEIVHVRFGTYAALTRFLAWWFA